MPTTSEKTATETDRGFLVERTSEAGPFTVDYVTFREEVDMAPILASLPGGRCSCPHWGTLLEGRITVHYEDHDEIIEAGEEYYMTPGHVPVVEAGSRLVMFSPTDEVKATNEAIAAAVQAG